MLGLIKKDFLSMKSSMKGMAIIIIMDVVMAFKGMFELSLILPLLGMILLISTLSYDEQTNFNAYACTLPNGRRNIVKSKYLLSILMVLICGLFSILVTCIVGYSNGNFDIISNISSLFGSLIGIILVISFMYPFMFKYGTEKGRIYLFILIFGGVLSVSFLSQIVEFSNLVNNLNSLKGEYVYLILFCIVSIIYFISCKITERILLKKEF